MDEDQNPPPEQCACEEPAGIYTSGVPGALAYVENGKVPDEASIERCDRCQRYESDQAAFLALKALGMTSEDRVSAKAPDILAAPLIDFDEEWDERALIRVGARFVETARDRPVLATCMVMMTAARQLHSVAHDVLKQYVATLSDVDREQTRRLVVETAANESMKAFDPMQLHERLAKARSFVLLYNEHLPGSNRDGDQDQEEAG